MESRLMSNWTDVRHKPTNLTFDIDKDEIMNQWKQQMGHDVPIRVCGPCGKKTFMTDQELLLLPITHDLLKCCKARNADLPDEKSLRYKAMHLMKHGKDTFRLTDKGFENGKVVICNSCQSNLKYAKRVNKPPVNTFAYYDIGKIPPALKKLTFAEKLAISKTVAFIPQIQFKPVFGKSNTGIKGHAFGIKATQNQIISSIVYKLPRQDLNEVVQLFLHGKKETWKIAKKLALQGPLNIRFDVIIPWLIWLKQIGNPEFTDVAIPDPNDQKELQELQIKLDQSVKQLLENAITSESGHIERMCRHVRSDTLDEQEGLNQTLNTALFRNTLISDENNTSEPMHEILSHIKQKIQHITIDEKNKSEINKVIENELINEYTENYKLLSCAFPYIFPFGITHEIISTSNNIKQLRENWMLFYDQRCAEEINLIFLLFDQLKRHKANSAVAFKIKHANSSDQKFINQVNAPHFKQSIEKAIENPNTSESRHLKNTLEPLVKIIGKNIPWSTYERSTTLNKLYALTYFFGIPTHFITISPSMRNNTLALRISVTDYKQKLDIPNITLRSQLMIQNPAAATHTFYRLIEKFFEIIIQLPISDYTGKTSNIKNLLSRKKNECCGAFGPIKAGEGVFEEQTSGNLHFHGLLYGAWNIKQLQQWLHDPKIKKQFEQLIDSHITCKIPKNLKTKINKEPVQLKDPYPKGNNIESTAVKYAARYNNHKHSHTCWKKNTNKCRLAMRQPKQQQTIITEIMLNSTGTPIQKFENGSISKPQTPAKNKHSFLTQDKRVIAFRLARQDEFEQMQVEFNPITTACLRCNTSTQILISSSQGKAAMFYCSKYMSKSPYQLKNILTLFAQAEEEYKKYGSKAIDTGAKTRKAKNILQKILNKSGLIEVSDQQATAAVMGKPSSLSTHKFSIIYPWQAVQHHHQKYNKQQTTFTNYESTLADLETDSNTGKAMSISSYETYLTRGIELKPLNHHDYCLHIGKITINQTTKERKYKPGRKTNKTFLFAKNSKAAKCFKQTIKARPEIPRLCGPPPPKYPGNEPVKNITKQTYKNWAADAKIFVEFYSLLFLPVNEDGTLSQPYTNILPWKKHTSWKNFWNVFKSFEDSTTPYKRSIWCIFQNMVENLHQSHNEKTLVTKWRFLEADERRSSENKENNMKNTKSENIQQQTEEDDEDIVAICETLRAKYGADEFLSQNEMEIKKKNQYLNKQIKIYQQMHTINATNEPRKQFPSFTVEQCKQLLKENCIIKEKKKIKPTKEINKKNSTDIILKVNSTKNIKLKPHQEEAIEQLKKLKQTDYEYVDVKPNQLLAILQGVPGAGKTVTASQLAQKLGLETIFSRTTSTAAAQLKAETINTILGLGLNKNDFTKTTISYQTKQKIIQTFQNIDLLIIDEMSMLTPVTLCRIDHYLRAALDTDYLFGGLDVLLIGDMWQFPPVAPGLAKPALYQAAVMLGLGLRLPNEAYRKGAATFIKFKMVTLKGQVRSSKKFNNWLNQIRNPHIEYPITDEWLAQINVLSKKDFNEDKSQWFDTSIVVSGNAERHQFIKQKITEFAKRHNEPILCWSCPIKVSKNRYEPLPMEIHEINDELIRCFVRGAPCIITETINTKIGLGKGTEGIYLNAAWENSDINIDTLQPQQIKNVPQPSFIIIKVQVNEKYKNVVIKPSSTQLKLNKNIYKDCLQHECQSAASVTFHKMQGKTVKRTILSLNSTSGISKKIYPITLPSIYVGCSRVFDHDHLRIFPLTTEEKNNLKKLKWDPYLPMFFKNWDAQGTWKKDGLKDKREEMLQTIKIKLGMIEINSITQTEAKQFINQLDLIVEAKNKNPTISEYKQALKKAHAEGVAILTANNNKLMNQQLNQIYKKIKQNNINKMSLKDLRYYAKRLGIQQCTTLGRDTLRSHIIKKLKTNRPFDSLLN